MADFVFNVASGKVNAYVERVATNDPADSTIVIVLLKTAEADSALRDHNNLAALLGGSSVEADFTNYSRKSLSDSVMTAPTPDHTNNRQDADAPDQTYAAAGGAANNTMAKALFCYKPEAASVDSAIIPLTAHDFVATTDGNDLELRVNAAGFYRSTPA